MRLLVATIIASACLTGSAHAQQQCLHGADSTPDQKARRSSALSVMRAINTAESAFASRNQRQYGTLKELLDSGALKPMLRDTPLNFESDQPLLGWKLEFSSNKDGYAFLLKDTTDPCSFAFFSTQDGLIFHGEPIR